MAIEREIPKDINKYETKLIGPLTTRQTVCIIPASILSISLYMLLKDVLPTDACIMTCIFVALPFLLCGWYKPNGLPFEKFVRTVFITTILAPKHRVYKTINYYETAIKSLDPPVDKKKEKEALKKAALYKSKNPSLKAYK